MTINASTLDARGLNCPLPILQTRKAIASLSSGEVLEVTATDPGSVKDMDAFCRQTGHALISSRESGGDYVFQIRKS
ncbi:MAG: sulfurtransferase TusA family protein [Pseudomonadota bacterium]|nr:sulfurtransferase TusA family protein [Pseudomonadota bacterium]